MKSPESSPPSEGDANEQTNAVEAEDTEKADAWRTSLGEYHDTPCSPAQPRTIAGSVVINLLTVSCSSLSSLCSLSRSLR